MKLLARFAHQHHVFDLERKNDIVGHRDADTFCNKGFIKEVLKKKLADFNEFTNRQKKVY